MQYFSVLLTNSRLVYSPGPLLSLFAWFLYIYIYKYHSETTLSSEPELGNVFSILCRLANLQLWQRVLKPPNYCRISFKRCWHFKRSSCQNLLQIRFSVTFRQNFHLQVRQNIALWNHSSLVQNSARKTDHRIYIATCKVCHEYHGQESRNYCLCSVHLDTKCR